MSASVRISRRAAQDLLRGLDFRVHPTDSAWAHVKLHIRDLNRACDELRAALKTKPAKKLRRQRKEAKRLTKREETAAVYEAVLARAGDCCENCGEDFSALRPRELDHMFGRVRVRQAVSNTWLICRLCHRAKTLSQPNAAYWWERMRRHCRTHRYTPEAAEFSRKLRAEELIAEAAEVSRVG